MSISWGFSMSKTTFLPFVMLNFTQTFNLNQPHLLFFCQLVIYTLWYAYHLHSIFVIGTSLWDLHTYSLWHDFLYTYSNWLLDFILLIWHQLQHKVQQVFHLRGLWVLIMFPTTLSGCHRSWGSPSGKGLYDPHVKWVLGSIPLWYMCGLPTIVLAPNF